MINLLVVVTLATAVALQQIPGWVFVNLAVVTAVLRILLWRYRVALPVPAHLALLDGTAWLGLGLVFYYETAGLSHPLAIYMEMYQALVRLMVLGLMIGHIWYALWALRKTLRGSHDIQKHNRLPWRSEQRHHV